MLSGVLRSAAIIMALVAALSPAGAQEPEAGLMDFQREMVRKLTGGEEIIPGVTLENRATPENRRIVRDYLAGLLGSMGLQPLRQVYREDGENVYALLPSTTGSQEYVVVGAHFDTSGRSPGASDNATGCAVVAEVARRLTSQPGRERNLLLVFFDEEERGLVGSRAFADWLVREGRAVVAVHTIDQLGWDQDGDGAIELELPYDGALDIYQRAAAATGFPGAIHQTEETGSDHSAFRRQGMPAVGLTEEYRNGDTTPHIHRPTDTWDTVDFDYLARGTRLVAAAVTSLLTEG